MAETTIKRFEEGVAAFIAANFTFSAPNDQTLALGRNVFVQVMPEGQEIKANPANDSFDLDNEPVLAIFTESGAGVIQSSSFGGKLEWVLRFNIRVGVVPERAKEILEELFSFLSDEIKGAKVAAPTGSYKIFGALFVERPDVFQTAEDGHALASGTMRLLAARTLT